jgi:hypothetical protein
MMLADPHRVHAKLLGVERFRGNVGKELIRGPRIVEVVVVAQREVAELHGAVSSLNTTNLRRLRGINQRNHLPYSPTDPWPL